MWYVIFLPGIEIFIDKIVPFDGFRGRIIFILPLLIIIIGLIICDLVRTLFLVCNQQNYTQWNLFKGP